MRQRKPERQDGDDHALANAVAGADGMAWVVRFEAVWICEEVFGAKEIVLPLLKHDGFGAVLRREFLWRQTSGFGIVGHEAQHAGSKQPRVAMAMKPRILPCLKSGIRDSGGLSHSLAPCFGEQGLLRRAVIGHITAI